MEVDRAGSVFDLQQFKRLNVAHNTTLLVCGRAETYARQLARKLIPEFESIVFELEFLSSMRTIEKRNSDIDEPGIGLVLFEADAGGVRLLDYINKRPINHSTSTFPLISTVVVLPQNVDADILKSVKSVGGANAYIQLPCSSSTAFVTILEALERRKAVEATFRDLKQSQVQNKKYPYMPIFGSSLRRLEEEQAGEEESEGKNIDGTKATKKTDTVDEMPSISSLFAGDNQDEWSDTSSVVPGNIKRLRKRERQRRAHAPATLSKGEKLVFETRERGTVDKLLLKSLLAATGSGTRSHAGAHQNNSSDDGSDSDSGSSSESNENAPDSQVIASTPTKALIYSQQVKREDCKDLLDPSKRPKWGLDRDRRNRYQEDRRLAAMMEIDMRPFIERTPPDAAVIHTVGGLDKHAADSCWKVLNPRSYRRTHMKTHTAFGGLDASSVDYHGGDLGSVVSGLGSLSRLNTPKAGTAITTRPRSFTSNGSRPSTPNSVGKSGAASRSGNLIRPPLTGTGGNGAGTAGAAVVAGTSAVGTHNSIAHAVVRASHDVRQNTNTPARTPAHAHDAAHEAVSLSSPSRHNSGLVLVSVPGSRKNSKNTNAVGDSGAPSKRASFISSLQAMPSSPAPVSKPTAGSVHHQQPSAGGQGVKSPGESPMKLAPITVSAAALHRSLSQASYDMSTGRSSQSTHIGNGTTRPASAAHRGTISRASSFQSLDGSTVAGGGGGGGGMHGRGSSSVSKPKALMRATKSVKKMVKELAPDIHVHKLIDVELYRRKVNIGERQLFEEGMKFEAEGEFDEAILRYIRAGKTSKDPHMSRLFIAAAYFRMNKFMVSLQHYTTAVKLIANVKGALYPQHDDFVAHYNRAVVEFRLGDDNQGLQDLEKAVKLDPTNIQAKELLALSCRRMGNYHQAMQLCEELKVLKAKLKEQQDLLEDQLQQQQKLNDSKHALSQTGSLLKTASEALDSAFPMDGSPADLPSVLPLPQQHQPQPQLAAAGGGVDVGTPSRSSGSPQKSSRPTTGTAKGGATNTAERRSSFHSRNGRGRSNVGAPRSYTDDSESGDTLHTQVIKIQESIEPNSLKARKAKALVNMEREIVENGGEAVLNAFKLSHGYKNSLHENFFLRPSTLQEALAIPPEGRKAKHTEVIVCALRLMPFLQKLSNYAVEELARVVEYRTLTSKGQIYSQNTPADAVCLVLRGSMQMRMEGTQQALNTDYVSLGDIHEKEVIGHIDMLFRREDTSFVNEIREMIVRDAMETTKGELKADSLQTSMARRESPSRAPSRGMMTHSRSTHTEVDKSFVSPDRDNVDVDAVKDALLNDYDVNEEAFPHSAVQAHRGASQFLEGSERSVDNENESNGQHILSNPTVRRSFSPELFMSYVMTSVTELLLVSETDFNSILMPHAMVEFKRRMEAIESCGVFRGWPKDEIIRIARMGQVRVFRHGDVILKQREKPEYFCIVMKGLLKAYKRPHRTEIITTKLAAAKEKARRFDTKYAYHHRLRNTLTAAGGNNRTQSGGGSPTAMLAATTSLEASLAALPKSIINASSDPYLKGNLGYAHLTKSEELRQEIAVEIARLEVLLQRALAADQKEKEEQDEGGNDDEAPTPESDKLAEIATLQWPMIFGEACILDPAEGGSRGTIVADTTCEVFMIHRTQLHTFYIGEKVAKRLEVKALHYPDDDFVVSTLKRKDLWKKLRAAMLESIPKGRWPSREGDVEPMMF